MKLQKDTPERFQSVKKPLGRLKSLIVFSDWIKFVEKDFPAAKEWFYKNQKVEKVNNSSVIFIPVDFSRLIQKNKSYILLYGCGIYWTEFSVVNQKGITTDARYISALLIPEEKWLDHHFNTEPFVYPPPYNFIMSDYMHEFPFHALMPDDNISAHRKKAFGRGLILAQLVFPLKEPLLMLRKTTERYDEFDSPTAPMRVLISSFSEDIHNEIALETQKRDYEQSLPGISNIRSDLLKIFPDKWSNELYIKGLKREIGVISKDFAFIGAPLILD